MASLGDISDLVEEEEAVETSGDAGCQPPYKNESAYSSESAGDRELTDDSSDASYGAYVDQCQSNSNKDPPSRVSSGVRTSRLHFGWRWRTLVLPFALFSAIIQYFI